MLRLSSLYKQSLYSFSKDLMINENFHDLRCVSLLCLVVMPNTSKVVMPRVLQANSRWWFLGFVLFLSSFSHLSYLSLLSCIRPSTSNSVNKWSIFVVIRIKLWIVQHALITFPYHSLASPSTIKSSTGSHYIQIAQHEKINSKIIPKIQST